MARKRKAVSVRSRFEVFKRDGFTCQYCGRTPPAVILEIDHIVPVASGGDNEEGNLLTSCKDCNSGKSDRHLEQVPQSLQGQIADKRARSEQVKAYNEFLLEIRQEQEDAIQRLGIYWFNKFKTEKDAWVFGESRQASIKIFLQSLAEVEIMDAIDIAFAKFSSWEEEHYKTWKYFCGICWRKIKGDVRDA